jgi:hypothetical protein
MSRHPISRCAVKACPVIGHWPAEGMCPMHRDDPDQIVTYQLTERNSTDE